MNRESLHALLSAVESREVGVDEALARLRHMPFEDLGFAKVDHHRSLRLGLPEVIFSEGKTAEQVADIFVRLATSGANVLATRADADKFAAVRNLEPRAEYNALARTITLTQNSEMQGKGIIAVVCAGTSDLPVAEEAAVTARLMGNQVDLIADVGVAGVHRLLAHRERLEQARVLIACAGMEGALPSVLGGLVAAPVIAVPTSIGYGAAFGGITALLGMLNSCSPNVSVVNIDNGFGAACVASLINRL